jgi:DNA processing protein
MEDLIFRIALTLIPGIGNVNGKNLVAYCGGVQAIFREKKRTLLKIPGVGIQTVEAVLNQNVFNRAEKEVAFLEKYSIKPLFYLDRDYPDRMKNCTDGPIMIYYKGGADLNNPRVISIVGTRSSTEYGRDLCKKLVEGLSRYNVLIVSGLAYGIDTWSHKAALDNNLPTVAILGHSLDRIYPSSNRSLAERMISNGGLISEFTSGTKPDRENFPMRNRIIAGMADAVVLVEAGNRGGALITSDIANSYNRDVFAFPGRVGDLHSEGCNTLIKTNRAALIQSADDIVYMLNWDAGNNKIVGKQPELFDQLTNDEAMIVSFLRESGDLDIDTIIFKSALQPGVVAKLLLKLEFEGMIRCMPGKIYHLL